MGVSALPGTVPAYVLDTSLVLGGQEPPRDGSWSTTSEAAAELKPGGRDFRRFEAWLAIGLAIRKADSDHLTQVEDAAIKAGTLARLSAADLSLLALALADGATLLTDDHTMLDVAARLGIATRTVNTAGIKETLDFRPRCSGCGRWFDVKPARGDCPVCGSPVKDRPTRPRGAGQ